MIRAEFDITQWDGPFDQETRARAQQALEHGQLLYFPRMPFKLSNSEMEFLDGRLTDESGERVHPRREVPQRTWPDPHGGGEWGRSCACRGGH